MPLKKFLWADLHLVAPVTASDIGKTQQMALAHAVKACIHKVVGRFLPESIGHDAQRQHPHR